MSLPVLVVTGMARETRLARGPGVIVVGSGGNAAQLRRSLAGQDPGTCAGVLSFGIAGGLDPALGPGDVVIASGVASGERRDPAHPALAHLLAERLSIGGLRPVRATIAGADRAVVDAQTKRSLRRSTGAAAVDMESHVAAEFAAAADLPFAAVRVICDPADRALPPLVHEALRLDGRVDLTAVLRSLARNPAQFAAMPRLARDARAAFGALRRCRDLLGIGRGFPDFRKFLGDVA